MVSNKKKVWDEAVDRGLIEDYVEYDDLTEKEIKAIIDSADEESAPECQECGEIGVDRGEGVHLCDECYAELESNTDPEKFYEDEDINCPECGELLSDDGKQIHFICPTCGAGEKSEDEVPEEDDIPEPVPEPVVEESEDDIPVVAPKPKSVPKKKYIKITRNVVMNDIPVGTLVTFKCKPGSNIRNYAGDMSAGLVLTKKSGVKTYSGRLTKKIKKDIQLKKIILLR